MYTINSFVNYIYSRSMVNFMMKILLPPLAEHVDFRGIMNTTRAKTQVFYNIISYMRGKKCKYIKVKKIY